MKETYVKPQLRVESFLLSQSIAASCGYRDDWYLGEPKHADKYSCAWDTNMGDVFWLESTHGCETVVGDEFTLGEMCYNAPEGKLQIFAS